jgi:thioredoxin reductase (NADPH)
MSKPTILAVDDEPAVLSAVARDLRKEYGADYNVVRAGSGAAALEALKKLKLSDEPVALLVVDQRMPAMTGVEFLSQALALYPDAKRVLLTAYADTDAAIRAINQVRLHHYLMKPWDPPEEHLYPVLTDLLDDWRAGFRPPFEGVRVVGHRWSADGHRIKDFLARNLIPYRWMDVEQDTEAQRLREAAGADVALPLVLLPDGATLSRPDVADLADRLGLHRRAESDAYDLVIVGGGPSGLAAGVYAASEGLRTLIIEREAPGGQAGMSSSIENYLGFPAGLSGGDLARRAVAQAKRFGAELLAPREAVAIRTQDGYQVVDLANGGTVTSQALLICTGVSYRTLDVPGADQLSGAGLYYGAAITEALAVRDQDVLVVGGGNSAGQAVIYLARFARTVTLLVRSGSLASGMSQYLVERIQETGNVVVRTNSAIAAVHGSPSLESVDVQDVRAGSTERLNVRALFLFIGAAPRTDWLGKNIQLDKQGFILTGPDLVHDGKRPHGWTAARDPLWLETSVPGVFAAGDVRHRSTKRVASAVGEGAMAVQFVHQHLSGSVLAPMAPVASDSPATAAQSTAPPAAPKSHPEQSPAPDASAPARATGA